MVTVSAIMPSYWSVWYMFAVPPCELFESVRLRPVHIGQWRRAGAHAPWVRQDGCAAALDRHHLRTRHPSHAERHRQAAAAGVTIDSLSPPASEGGRHTSRGRSPSTMT